MVYLSFHASDRAAVETTHQALHSAGIQVRGAQAPPLGVVSSVAQWRASCVDSSRAVVVFVSKAYQEDQACCAEYEYVLQQRKRKLFVMTEKFPNRGLGIALG